MDLLVIAAFFVIAFGLGYAVTFFIKRTESLIERFFICVGVGLGTVPILGVLLNLLKIKLYVWIFILLALIAPAYGLYKILSEGKLKRIKDFKLKKSTIYIITAVFFALVLFVVFFKGANVYPYLEDDDPWLHAVSAKYFASTYTYSQFNGIDVAYYLEPYPPGFVILMGILQQLGPKVIWMLKFFNVLIIALGIVFFYLFAKEFIGDQKKALLATFFLTVIPCFLSHFIWAQTLALNLFFPAFYCMIKTIEDKRWFIPAMVITSSIIVTQMSNAFIFGLFFLIFFAVKSLSKRRFLTYFFIAGFIGAMIGFALFWTPTVMKYGIFHTAERNTINLNDLGSIATKISGGDVLYSWSDVIIARTSSKMDNPIGIGVVLFFLLVFSLIVLIYFFIRNPKSIISDDSAWKVTSVIWLLVAFAGIHGNRLPFPMLMPHRWWAIMAIAIALLCVEGFFWLGKISERFKIHRFFVYTVIVLGVLLTSGYPKYVVETSFWPFGAGWGSVDELRGYLTYVAPLPDGTKVFPMCSHELKVLSFDKIAESWDLDYAAFKKIAFNSSASRIHSWLKSNGYEYMTLDAFCLRDHSMNETNDKLLELGNSTYFGYAGGEKGFFMFKVL